MSSKTPGTIKKLEEAVINKIAAGEVVQRPANALKELLENSLDAGARSIHVVVKAGGMKILQIQDDGCGIRKDDLPILCERFTTSKLEKFEDLQSIGTYGFRGEALASVSHVSRLTIITKTSDTQCAYRAEYQDGKLKEYPGGGTAPNPRTCAGKQGTTIIAEDLFYNMETRRRALKSVPDEHSKILEVVTKYAIHNSKVAFSLKKFGETMTEVNTPANSSILDNIKIIYGHSISRELLNVTTEDKTTGFKLNGYISNVNYSTKKLVFLLFVNHRLVDSSALRKSIEAVYYNYLPKGTHPFVYLSIEIDPRNVDVNVHPTKHEVILLHENLIVTAITEAVENVLVGSNQSRTFLVQSLLPGASHSESFNESSVSSHSKRKNEASSSSVLSPQKTAPKHLVRTDPKLQKLDKFLTSTPDPEKSHLQSFQDASSFVEMDTTSSGNINISNVDDSRVLKNVSNECVPSQLGQQKQSTAPRKKRDLRLRSLKIMKENIVNDTHEGLLDAFRNHTFVGCVDRTLCLVQHELNLYLCNTFRLSSELFYQKMVEDFGNFGTIGIQDPISIKELVQMAVDTEKYTEENKTKQEIADEVHNQLIQKRTMLNDYFSLDIDENGKLLSLPLILDNYYPNLVYLPMYIINLAKKVNWTDEKKCFESVCHVTSIFYGIQPGTVSDNEELTGLGKSWKWTIEHVIFPEIKKYLRPPKNFAEDSTVVLLTSLPELYKVFERC